MGGRVFVNFLQDDNGGNNAQSMFGINIPSQNYSKKLLDKLKPEVFKKVYDDTAIRTLHHNIISNFISLPTIRALDNYKF